MPLVAWETPTPNTRHHPTHHTKTSVLTGPVQARRGGRVRTELATAGRHPYSGGAGIVLTRATLPQRTQTANIAPHYTCSFTLCWQTSTSVHFFSEFFFNLPMLELIGRTFWKLRTAPVHARERSANTKNGPKAADHRLLTHSGQSQGARCRMQGKPLKSHRKQACVWLLCVHNPMLCAIGR